MNHHMDQAAGLVEPLDERVALYLKEIIRNGCRRVKELQSRASEFVREKIFHGERPPESLRRRFNANRKKVRSLMTRVKLETCHSKLIKKCCKTNRRVGKMEPSLLFAEVYLLFVPGDCT